jgi:hypothetical protein
MSWCGHFLDLVIVSEYEPLNGQKLWHSHKIIIRDFILATNFIIQNKNKHKTLIEVLYGSRCTQLPLIENSFNGCQGHPPLCLPPRPDRIQTMFGRAVFIQLTV